MQLVFVEEVTPSRHLTVSAVGDGFDNRFLSTAPQPYVVGQVRSNALDTLTFVAVTGKTSCWGTVKQDFTTCGTFFIVLVFGFG